MIDPRRKMLILAALVAAGLFLFDKAALSPWLDAWKKLSTETHVVDQEIQTARASMAREKLLREGWAKVQALLQKPRTPDVQTHFVAHLGEIRQKVGVSFDIQGARDQQQGDFREYVYETKFKLTWEQLVRLLVELHNSKEFLKPSRINISSQYEREERLDLDLRVSTIEYAPVPVKTGTKP